MEKAYETYKDSGVEWIGDIPESWDSIKLKFLGYLYSGLSGKKGDDFRREDSEFNKHYIPFTNIANNFQIDSEKLDTVEIFENENQNDVKKNDLFFLMSSENYDDIGKTSVLKDELNNTYLNSFCKGFRLYNQEEVDASFLNYLLSGNIYRKTLSIEAKGFTRINLQMGKIENLPVIIPNSKQEQTQIAAYLDYHTQLIDTLISKKETLIQKLQEQRQAIINEAVTKGLNKNVALKDSGIEWLGEIPEHWEVKKLKYVVDCNKNTLADKYEEDFNINYIEIGNVSIDKGIEKTKVYKYSEAPSRAKRIVKTNDVIISTVRTYLKAITTITEEYNDYIASTGFAVLTATNITHHFLSLITQSDCFIDDIISKSVGVSYPAINASDIMNIPIPVPEADEQILIYQNVEKKVKNNFEAIGSIQTSIQKLKDYRQSLISEAVTGKIDVRDWQQPNS
ncbi:restriction endonuclease subunit S [Xanthomarina gelatinilytica]|uniref:restriction endonuclease subunit S n=1 Tax=Xanthomarina gelatinilytica TaxID=1137281 RepID=UPI003AA7D699